jgi:hypothetical protein
VNDVEEGDSPLCNGIWRAQPPTFPHSDLPVPSETFKKKITHHIGHITWVTRALGSFGRCFGSRECLRHPWYGTAALGLIFYLHHMTFYLIGTKNLCLFGCRPGRKTKVSAI